jgi:putative endonuclease
MYYTYIIQSESTGKLYIGLTNNIEARLIKHKSNKNFNAKHKGPWKLLFSQKFIARSDAVELEKKFKSYKFKAYVLDEIKRRRKIKFPK